MEIINYIVLAILGIALTVVSLYFLILIANNVRQGRVVRKLLAERVESLRMSKMLHALGLDFNKYLHSVPLCQINESIGKCETCSTTDECDQKLKVDKVGIKDIGFCPNQECLGQFHKLEKKGV